MLVHVVTLVLLSKHDLFIDGVKVFLAYAEPLNQCLVSLLQELIRLNQLIILENQLNVIFLSFSLLVDALLIVLFVHLNALFELLSLTLVSPIVLVEFMNLLNMLLGLVFEFVDQLFDFPLILIQLRLHLKLVVLNFLHLVRVVGN